MSKSAEMLWWDGCLSAPWPFCCPVYVSLSSL
uniref:Uncharacterized protein n=1 Tax=Arundo donax TaxID=35708 RepID=A0A0A8ZTP5_ARUDO